MYKISFYVPPSHCETVKTAMFAAGAGKIEPYECCAFQVLGEGQFMPKKGSQPFIGQIDQIERVAEYKVEMICDPACIHAAVQALKTAHPYETPAFDVIKLEAF
jgi:structural toxin protein (hemagglutinin/hemolysin) RtxA